MRARLLLLLLTLWTLPPVAWADILVIVHVDSPLQQLAPQQVSDLYLGRQRSTASGERLQVIDLPRNSELRSRFFSSLNGMSLRSVNAYWARLQFSGDSQPPIPLPDSSAVLAVVRNNRLAIGYVDAGEATAGVRTVLTLRDP